MSFCCGASMIGTKGTLRHYGTLIHNVPLLLCPVCNDIEIHHSIIHEYEILAEYATGDDAPELNFEDYVEKQPVEDIYENCVNQDEEDPLDIVHCQIDISLDLLGIAKQIGDEEWVDQLKSRLRVLSQRRAKLKRKKSIGGKR